MKRLLAVMAMVCGVVGCSLPFQLAADLAGNMAAPALKPNSPKISKAELLERIDVNDYSIEVMKAKNLPGLIGFGAKKQGKTMGAFVTSQEEFQRFTSMNEQDKKQFLHDNFLKGGLDLGSVDSKPPTSVPTIPIPSFAPSPR